MSTHRELLKLMKVPIDQFDDPLTILQLSHVSAVNEMFDYTGRKALACHLVQAIVNKVAYITSADQVRWWGCGLGHVIIQCLCVGGLLVSTPLSTSQGSA